LPGAHAVPKDCRIAEEIVMGETHREGGCGCGAARYRLEGDPIFVNNCYCTLCQRQTGSTSVINAFYETERLTLVQGSLSDHAVVAGGGGTHVIRRCAECGTALWSHYPSVGDLGAGVRVTTLDDPTDIRPDAAIHVGSRQPWVTLPEGIPAFEQGYKAKELLPPERFARLMELATRFRARQAGEEKGA
jgi:hypothetical protein